MALGLNIPRALPRADSRPADRPELELGLGLARVLALVRGPALAHVPEQAALEGQRKPRARSVLLRAAAAEASNSTRRPKKAR